MTPSERDTAASPTVSVALCTYNSARYITPQLSSILAQKPPPLEVVVCDDGSTDETLDLVRAQAAEHPSGGAIRIAATARVGGTAPNFSRALAHCRGDYIALSDHDDVWAPGRLSVALAAAQDAPQPALVFSDARLIDGDGVPLGRTLFEAYRVRAVELDAIRRGQAFAILLQRNIVTGATVLFDRTLLEAAMPLGGKWVHDEWLAIIAAALGSVTCVEEPLIDYRIHGANQIGIPPRSLFRKLWRALWPGNSRFISLQTRAVELATRLEGVGADARFLDTARRLLAFQNARREYAWLPLVRGRAIVRQWRLGTYKEFERWPAIEAWRDLLQKF
jgi:hypothetical protein